MAPQTEPEIVLYDLACIKNVCFSPVVWRIRLMLNYKRIPYRTVFLEFPDIEPTLKSFGIPPPTTGGKYTVPAIQHIPTQTYLMDSVPIAAFLESTYPSPPVPLKSERGTVLVAAIRGGLGPVLHELITPRELFILSPRAQEYFRRTRGAGLAEGQRLEDLLEAGRQERAWEAVEKGLRAAGEVLRGAETEDGEGRGLKENEGPFILGKAPSYADFYVAGNLQCMHVVDEEGLFRRIAAYPGFGEVYEACLPWMEKKD